jgi:hypothetical protein
MALVNILPSWVVLIGRDLIRTLGGEPAPEPEGPGTAKPYAAPSATDVVHR